jgi:hypothetical protein
MYEVKSNLSQQVQWIDEKNWHCLFLRNLFLFSSLEKEIFQSLTLEHYLQEKAISISHAMLVTFKLLTKAST